jgi:hypothetical protein
MTICKHCLQYHTEIAKSSPVHEPIYKKISAKQLMTRLTKKTREKRIAIKPASLSKELEIQKKWKLRSQITAKFIANGSSVLDIGAGSMVLRKYLQPNCRYQPCDLYSRCDGCLVADLNNKEFPEGKYDWVVMLGTFQFLKDPAWAIAQCRKVAKYSILIQPHNKLSPTFQEN